jgi:pimeloyl-ACP methyl ester carboxylesterase
MIRFFFTTFSPLFPKIAGNMAFELFQHPHAKKTRKRELALFTAFSERRIPHPEEDIFLYEKGPANGYPVVLVHGWESNPGSLFGVADALQQNGFRTLVLGLPAHGKSIQKKTNMVHASRYIRYFLEKEGLTEDFSMITHSFGSGASTIALKESGIRVDQLLFLTSPDRIMDIFTNYRDMIRLGERAFLQLIDRVEIMIPFRISEFNIPDFLKQVNFKQLIVFHDEQDRVLPYQNALAIKQVLPETRLVPLKDKGHYRLLWDDEVIQQVLTTLNEVR